jgi:hypothetical protein
MVPIPFRPFHALLGCRRSKTMSKKPSGTQASSSKGRPETPESLRRALKSAAAASAELVQTSKSLLQSTSSVSSVPSKRPPLPAIAILAGLVHSHTVRTALTCGPTVSSPSATLGCVKDLHEPILPLVTEYQNLVVAQEYPQFFVDKTRQEIVRLLDAFGPFVGEVAEIACGDASVESRERLQYSGMMMDSTKRIQQFCKDGPLTILHIKLKETQEMSNDALEELQTILNPETNAADDGWSDDPTAPAEYTASQKSLAKRVERKLHLIHLLYKATSKRRMTNVTYSPDMRSGIDVVYDLLTTLSVDVDNLVSGISDQEDPMGLELTVVQVHDAARKLAAAVRTPFNGISDSREVWFDSWLTKFT